MALDRRTRRALVVATTIVVVVLGTEAGVLKLTHDRAAASASQQVIEPSDTIPLATTSLPPVTTAPSTPPTPTSPAVPTHKVTLKPPPVTPTPSSTPTVTTYPLTQAQRNVEAHCGNLSQAVLPTFDDYGDPQHIYAIEKVLLKYHSGAMFELIGSWAKQHPDVVAKLRADGFWVGNHSATHPIDPDLAELPAKQIASEIDNGVKSTYFRPPGGSYNGLVEHLATERGYHICTWTVDTNDWRKLPASTLVNTVLHGTTAYGGSPAVGPGSVILMHLLPWSHSLEALPQMLSGIQAKGLALCRHPSKPTTANIPYPLPCS